MNSSRCAYQKCHSVPTGQKINKIQEQAKLYEYLCNIVTCGKGDLCDGVFRRQKCLKHRDGILANDTTLFMSSALEYSGCIVRIYFDSCLRKSEYLRPLHSRYSTQRPESTNCHFVRNIEQKKGYRKRELAKAARSAKNAKKRSSELAFRCSWRASPNVLRQIKR